MGECRVWVSCVPRRCWVEGKHNLSVGEHQDERQLGRPWSRWEIIPSVERLRKRVLLCRLSWGRDQRRTDVKKRWRVGFRKRRTAEVHEWWIQLCAVGTTPLCSTYVLSVCPQLAEQQSHQQATEWSVQRTEGPQIPVSILLDVTCCMRGHQLATLP
jgi:hypothetical protein